MMMKRPILALIFGIILLAGVGFYIYNDQKGSPSSQTSTSTNPLGIETSGNAIVNVEEIPQEPTKPNLDRPYTPPSNLPESARAQSQTKYAALVAKLKADPDLFKEWLELALYYDAADDFAGAEAVWIYVSQKWSTDPTAYSNLGNLYRYNIKNIVKAEQYLKAAITVDPKMAVSYGDLANFYEFDKKSIAAAKQVYLDGLKAIPGSYELMIPLAQLYKKDGDNVNAKKYLELAATAARAAGKADLAAQLEADAQTL